MTRLRSVVLFGKQYWWDFDLELDKCSIASHCFVSNLHTHLPGCRRPKPKLTLRKAPWGC